MSFPNHMSRMLVLLVIAGAAACDDPVASHSADTPGAAAVVPTCFGSSRKTEDLLACVTLDAVRQHQASLQLIADNNSGNRVAGSAGHDASAQYVAGLLGAAGYNVTLQPFSFTGFLQTGPSTLQRLSAPATTYVENADFNLFSFTAAGDITGLLEAVDLTLGPGSTSGCEAADFAGFTPGNIALIERGTCTFQLKAENAAAAGAIGVVIFNRSDQTGLVFGTLSSGYSGGIPVVGVTFAIGVEWATSPTTVRIVTDVASGTFMTHNVIAETSSGNAGNVVLLGGHLDSVHDGPGINDNASGVAALLETALQMSQVKTRNRLRFAFWSAHERGNLGSIEYVSNLSQTDLDAIALYVDVINIGSPNFVHFLLDGDGSQTGVAGPAGSGALESYLSSFYSSRQLTTVPFSVATPVDFSTFASAGIPVGALFGGNVGIKTVEEAFIFGGVAGEQYDPCYHLACDTYANVSLSALDVNSDAVAYVALGLAMNTELVNGIKGKGRFKTKNVGPAASSSALATR